MGLAIDKEETQNPLQKQWDTVTIAVEPVQISYWGIEAGLMPPLLRLLKKNGIDIKAGKKNLITFGELKQVLEYLHSKDFDTSNLTGAVQQAIAHEGSNTGKSNAGVSNKRPSIGEPDDKVDETVSVRVITQADPDRKEYQTTTELNMHSGPGTAFPVSVILPKGKPVLALKTEDNWTFVSIQMAANEGWVSNKFLLRSHTDLSEEYLTTTQLNLRSGPGTAFPVSVILPKGKPVLALKTEDDWTLVSILMAANEGWVSNKLLVRRKDDGLPSNEFKNVGAYTEDGTEMELDLQTQQGYPQGFYYSGKERENEGLLPFNDKWILVAGTGTGKLSDKEKIMAGTISQLLAREGFGLICGGWSGVDKVVSESFADFFITKQIPYKDRLIQLIEAGQKPSYEVGDLRVLDKDEDWYQEALKQTNALIMIGGKGGTYLAYEQASNIGIPVLPIPQTGGDALRAFNKIIKSIDSSISPSQLNKLNQPINSIDDAKIISGSILNILNQLTKENRKISPIDFKSTVKELYESRPIVIEKDPQKNRWGGAPVRNGKRLMASVEKSSKWYYDVTIDLITEDGSPMHGDVAFFLHSSFKDPIRFTRASENRAQIRVRASNAFAIGAYTEDGTTLELDLQTVEGYPKDFYYIENGTGEFQFYTEEEICGLVGSRIDSAEKFVTGYLLIFQTRKQKTWLVATSKSLFVLLDDEETRKDNKPIKTSFQKKNALPLNFTNSQNLESSFLVKFSAEEKWWYCSKDLFSESKMLSESVQKLVKNLSPEQLTSLKFQLTVESADSTLESKIKQGQEDERENEQSTQGGVPLIPYEIENFTSVLQPLIEYLGNVKDDFPTRSGLATPQGFIVLVALDDMYNCILSFGEIAGQNAWSGKSEKPNLSAGFLTHNFNSRKGKLSYPTARGNIKEKGMSSYSIRWDLDSVTFANSIDRKNENLVPTTSLPEKLQLIILSSIVQLPFLENDFSQTSAVNLWKSSHNKNILKKSSQFDATISLSANKKTGSEYLYTLSEVFSEDLYDEYGKPYQLSCTKFSFEKK
jgi:uncharacterized protein YraI